MEKKVMKSSRKKKIEHDEAFQIFYEIIPSEMSLLLGSISELLNLRTISPVVDEVIQCKVRVLDARGVLMNENVLSVFRDELLPILNLRELYLSPYQLPSLLRQFPMKMFHSITKVDVEHITWNHSSAFDLTWLRKLPNLVEVCACGSMHGPFSQFPADLPVRHLVVRSHMSQMDVSTISRWPDLEVLDISEMYMVHTCSNDFPTGVWPSLRTVIAQTIHFFNNLFGAQVIQTLVLQRVKGVSWMAPPENRLFTLFQEVWMEPGATNLQQLAGRDGTLRAKKIFVPRHPDGAPFSEALYIIPLYFNPRSIEEVVVETSSPESEKTISDFLKPRRIPFRVVFDSIKDR